MHEDAFQPGAQVRERPSPIPDMLDGGGVAVAFRGGASVAGGTDAGAR